jgi:hypothetical protein
MVSSVIIIPCSMQSMPASIAPTMCLVSDCCQLFGGVLLGARGAGRGHHAAGRAALDELRPVLDLVANRLADLVDPVGDALLDCHSHDAGRQAALRARVEMAPGRTDGVTGRNDAWPLDPARSNGIRERDIDEVPARLYEQSEIAHRGEAGAEGPLAVGHGSQRHLHGVHAHGVRQSGIGSPEDEIDLHVHEPRDQRQVGQIDHPVGTGGGR